MVTTTKTAPKRDTRLTPKPSKTARRNGASATQEALPDMAGWIERTFWSGDGAAVPPGVALLRANPMAAGVETMLDSVAQVQAELARFGAQRMHRALEAQAEILSCRSPSELRHAQEGYLHDLAEDYAYEWSRLFGYGMRVGLGQPVPPPPGPDEERHATPL